jgi:hypothetical protein
LSRQPIHAGTQASGHSIRVGCRGRCIQASALHACVRARAFRRARMPLCAPLHLCLCITARTHRPHMHPRPHASPALIACTCILARTHRLHMHPRPHASHHKPRTSRRTCTHLPAHLDGSAAHDGPGPNTRHDGPAQHHHASRPRQVQSSRQSARPAEKGECCRVLVAENARSTSTRGALVHSRE